MSDTSDDPQAARAALLRLRTQLDIDMRARFDRSLPLAELVTDRWERAKRLGFAEGASIYDSAFVLGTVAVGAHSWIGPWVMLDGSGGGIAIGAWCSLAAGCQIYTHDTVLWAVSGGALPPRQAPVSIADKVYIGSQTLILPGTSIGTMAVVAANSLVNGDVPARTIVAGTPARPIGRVEGDGADVRLVYERDEGV